MHEQVPTAIDEFEARRLWAEAFEKSGIAIAIGDAVDNRVVAVNPTFAAQRGGRPADFKGQRVIDLFAPECRDEARAHIVCADQQGHASFASEHLTRDGRRLPVLVDVTVMQDANGRPTSRWVYVSDLSSQRRVESELQQEKLALENSEQRLRLAQSAARAGTWEWDVVTGRNYWTDEAFRLYDLEPGSCEASYEAWLDRIHPDDRERAAAMVAEAASRGDELQIEWRVNSGGPPRWLYSRGQPQLDAQGRVLRYLGVVIDVTERKSAELALRASQSRYRELFLANPFPMWVFDVETLVFLDVNESTVRQYGYSREEFLGMTIKQIRPASDAALVDETVKQVRAGRWRTGIWRHRRKDGTEMLMDITARNLSFNDRPAIVVLANDVTVRVQAEQEIRKLNAELEQRVAERTAQLEHANRAKTDFLANMSHELRTPLNAIIGFSQVLEDGLAGDLHGRQREFVRDIHEAGRHLLELINDVLDLSKVEAGVQSLDLTPQDVGALLRSTVVVVREKAHTHRIQLEVDVGADVCTMLADARKMRQIAFNLLSNAVKFTPDGGTVRLAARRCRRESVVGDPRRPGRVVPLATDAFDDYLEISVSDTGPGIPAEKLGLLFEPFVQLDSSASRIHAGTGLGLSLTRRLAELHGGTVGVESSPGCGSRFIAWLPYRPVAPVETSVEQ